MRNLLTACLLFFTISCLFCACGEAEPTEEDTEAIEEEDPTEDLNLEDEK